MATSAGASPCREALSANTKGTTSLNQIQSSRFRSSFAPPAISLAGVSGLESLGLRFVSKLDAFVGRHSSVARVAPHEVAAAQKVALTSKCARLGPSVGTKPHTRRPRELTPTGAKELDARFGFLSLAQASACMPGVCTTLVPERQLTSKGVAGHDAPAHPPAAEGAPGVADVPLLVAGRMAARVAIAPRRQQTPRARAGVRESGATTGQPSLRRRRNLANRMWPRGQPRNGVRTAHVGGSTQRGSRPPRCEPRLRAAVPAMVLAGPARLGRAPWRSRCSPALKS